MESFDFQPKEVELQLLVMGEILFLVEKQLDESGTFKN